MEVKLPLDFKEFLNLLQVHEVEYLLIGAYAVGYHGYPRATNDLDIWIAATSLNAERVVEALRDFGFDVPELSPQLLLSPKRIIRIGEEPIRIEILNWASGVEFGQCYNKRIVDKLDGVEVNLIGMEDLKVNKTASGRLKDLADLENLP